MARKSIKPAKGQLSLFGVDPSPKRKEVDNGRRHGGVEASPESTDVTGAVASDQHADESTGDTVGESVVAVNLTGENSPAGTSTDAPTSSVAQPPGMALPSREGQSTDAIGAEAFFGLSADPDGVDRPRGRRSKGASGASPVPLFPFHRPIRRLTDEERREAHERCHSGPWTDEEIRRYVRFCPDCGRVVWELIPGRVADPLPRERERIAALLAERFTEFGKRAPMRNFLGKWVRPAHDCTAEPVTWHPKRGWKPDPKIHDSDVYDMG